MARWNKSDNLKFAVLNGLVDDTIIANEVGRSRDAIRSKRRRFNMLQSAFLFQDHQGKPYSDNEKRLVEIMRLNKVMYRNIAKRMGRTTKGVRRLAERNQLTNLPSVISRPV